MTLDDLRRGPERRGVPAIETLARDLGYAWRSLRRAPLAALTIVGTIALGLGLITVVFTFLNHFLFRVDAVRDPHQLFAAERPVRPGARAYVSFTRPEFDALRRETGVFVEAAAIRSGVSTRIDGRAASGVLVSGSFFGMLGVPAALGRTLAPGDEDDGGRAVVVLSRRGWEKLFAADPAVVGRTVQVNGHPYQVVGVMPGDFRGLRPVAPDYWAPLALVGQFRLAAPGALPSIEIVGRLQPGLDPQAAAAALTAWAVAQPAVRPPGREPPHVTLRPSRGVLSTDRREAVMAVAPIFVAFGLILLIGCANVANLLLARGLSRHREIAVRLSLGATRRRVVCQLLAESLLLALAATPLALLISRALFVASIELTSSLLPAEFVEASTLFVPAADWRVLLFLFGGGLVSAGLFGLIPALHATRFELLRAMRGDVVRDARPGRVRQLLIGAQVTASALLLVSAAVFLRSSVAAAGADTGVRTSDTMIVGPITESARPAMLDAVRGHAAVRAHAAAWPQATGEGAYAEAAAGPVHHPVGLKLVSPEYFSVLGVELLRGRPFAGTERSPAAGVAVVSESVARRFWPGADPLGQAIRLDPPRGQAARAGGAPQLAAGTYTVVGIARDVRSPVRLFELGYAGVYLPTSPEQAATALILQVHGDPVQVRLALLNALTRLDPALGHITTMRMMAELETAILRVVFWTAMTLAGLALAFTVSGLFSVLSYLVEQRKREIGVRMALGATPADVVRLVLAQSLGPIAAGVAAGGGLALAVALVLRSTPAAAMMGTLIRAFDPLTYAASLSLIVATCLAGALVPARRAARIDPADTLRAD